MNPSPEAIYHSELLSNLAIAYIQKLTKFIGLRMLPIIPTARQSAKYPMWDKFDMNRDEAKAWEDGKEPVPFQLRYSTDTYNAEVFALAYNITRMQRDAAKSQGVEDGILKLRQTAMRTLVYKLLIRVERLILAKVFATGTWTGLGVDQTGVVGVPIANQFRKFTDKVNATPISTIRAYLDLMEELTLMRPDTVAFGAKAWTAFALHPEAKDQFKYVDSRSLTAEMAAGALEVDQVYRAAAGYNSALPGDPNAAAVGTMQFINGADIWIGYVNRDAPTENEVGAMKVFGWTDMVPGSPAGIVIEELPREAKTKNDPVQGYTALDAKITAPDCGALLVAAV